jgi:hypothetical protein
VSWFSAVPVIAACVAIMYVPGLLSTYALGLRGIAAWAIAPIVPITVAAVSAIIAPSLGMRLSIWVLLVPSLVIAAIIALVSYLLRRRWPARQADGRQFTYAVLGGLAGALAIGVVTAKWAITKADNFSATFDSVFHYHVLAYIADTGNGSALSVGTLAVPGVKPSFYPVAWHDLAAILQTMTGASVPTAGNVITVVIALLIWPLSCVLLARQLFGPAKLAVGVTAALSLAFPAFPWTLMGYGVLWPNMLGLALVPAGLAVVMSIANLAKQDAIGRSRAWLILPVMLLATAVSHPNALFSLAVLTIPLLATWLFVWVRDQHRAGRTVRGLVIGAAMVVAAAVIAKFVNEIPMVNAIKVTRWPAFENVSQAVGEVVMNATNRKAAAWLLSIVVVIGIVSCIRQRSRRWLVAGHVLSGALFVVAAGINSDDTAFLTGFWYNDSWRLAAMVPITGVPLAAIGVLAITVAIRNKVAALPRIKLPERATSRAVLAPALVALFAIVTVGYYAGEKATFIEGSYYQLDGGGSSQNLVTKDKVALMMDAQKIVPEDALVAANPFTGATALWPLADRRLLIPNLDPLMMTPDQAYLARNLIFADRDPKVCELVDKFNVQYLLSAPVEFVDSEKDNRLPFYAGLREPNGHKGFERVAQEGSTRLYKITACGAGRS